MEKSIKNAFTFMFKDKNLNYKVLIIFLLCIPSFYSSYFLFLNKINISSNIKFLLVLSLVIGYLFKVMIYGYFTKFIHNVITSKNDDIIALPEWKGNISNYLFLGIKKIFSLFLVLTVLWLSTTILGIISNIIFHTIIPAFISLYILLLAFVFLYTALDNIFCTDFKISSFFAWKTAKNIIFTNIKIYFQVFLIAITPLVLMQIFGSTKSLIFVYLIVLPIISIYLNIVYAYLVGIINQNKEQTEIVNP